MTAPRPGGTLDRLLEVLGVDGKGADLARPRDRRRQLGRSEVMEAFVGRLADQCAGGGNTRRLKFASA